MRYLKLFHLVLFLHITCLSVKAELKPEEVLVVYNKKMPDSKRAAFHYSNKRNIPSENLIELETTVTETVTRERYNEEIRNPLRDFLSSRKGANTIRSLVLVYGVPLKVRAPVLSAEERELLRSIQEKKQAARELSMRSMLALSKALSLKTSSYTELTKLTDRDFARIVHKFLISNRGVIRVAAEDTSKWSIIRPEVRSLGGMELVHQMRSLDLEKDSRDNALKRSTELMQSGKPGQALEEAFEIVERWFGAAGVFARTLLIDGRLSVEQAQASVDSELSILSWEIPKFAYSKWIKNPLYGQDPAQFNSKKGKVFLVTRLDGPSIEQVISLIDKSVAAEKSGLKGTVYIDSRGIRSKESPYYLYDNYLAKLAELFEERSSLPVEFDFRSERITEAKDVAVYVGWYLLRSYEDIFEFADGAIGFHIASEEAVSLREPRERGWCKNALERGITATLGPTAEPYVQHFPNPVRMFELMLSGNYTLAEAYYSSVPSLSWRMTLVGDPLYNPWKTP